jgi:DNA-binding transcriptional ArsR family regulator
MVQYAPRLDASFGALADGTRRRILERLGRGNASITELAEGFDMTLTGMKKHVHVLERAGLVSTRKIGRVRFCRLAPRRLDQETDWISRYHRMVESQLDHLSDFLERTSEEEES